MLVGGIFHFFKHLSESNIAEDFSEIFFSYVGKPTLTEKLISLAPNVDIHIIPDSDAVIAKGKKTLFEKPYFAKLLKGLAVSAAVLLLSSYSVIFFQASVLPKQISLRFICLAF